MVDTLVTYFPDDRLVVGFAMVWGRDVHGSLDTGRPATFKCDGRYPYRFAEQDSTALILIDHSWDKPAGWVQSVTKTRDGLFVIGRLRPGLDYLDLQGALGLLYFSPGVHSPAEQRNGSTVLKGGVIDEISMTTAPGLPRSPAHVKAANDRSAALEWALNEWANKESLG